MSKKSEFYARVLRDARSCVDELLVASDGWDSLDYFEQTELLLALHILNRSIKILKSGVKWGDLTEYQASQFRALQGVYTSALDAALKLRMRVRSAPPGVPRLPATISGAELPEPPQRYIWVLDGEDSWIPALSRTCAYCRHLSRRRERACRAYPYRHGIPMEIWMGESHHQQAYAGDNGIQFEPVDTPLLRQKFPQYFVDPTEAP